MLCVFCDALVKERVKTIKINERDCFVLPVEIINEKTKFAQPAEVFLSEYQKRDLEHADVGSHIVLNGDLSIRAFSHSDGSAKAKLIIYLKSYKVISMSVANDLF